jgi:hypothetical protein
MDELGKKFKGFGVIEGGNKKKNSEEGLPQQLPTLFDMLGVERVMVEAKAYQFASNYSAEVIDTINLFFEKLKISRLLVPKIGDKEKIENILVKIKSDAETRFRDQMYFTQSLFGEFYTENVITRMYTRMRDFDETLESSQFDSIEAITGEYERITKWKEGVQAEERELRAEMIKMIEDALNQQVDNYIGFLLENNFS